MQNKSGFQEFSDLFLRREWIKHPRLRLSWQILLGCLTVGAIILFTTATSPLAYVLNNTNNGVLGFRIIIFAIFITSLVSLFRLTFYYFKYTIEQGHTIVLDNIVGFYLTMILIFGVLYLYAFLINPDLFKYNPLYIQWIPAIGSRSPESWFIKFSFVLYSVFESVGAKSTLIESNSILVSMLNYVQTLYCFCLVSLLIAGYINQRTNKLN